MPAWKDEQTKLTATFLNNVAVATVTAGVLVPAITVVYAHDAPTAQQILLLEVVSPSLMVLAIALHSLGRLVLRSVGGTP